MLLVKNPFICWSASSPVYDYKKHTTKKLKNRFWAYHGLYDWHRWISVKTGISELIWPFAIGRDLTFLMKEWQISRLVAADCWGLRAEAALGVNASRTWPEMSEKASNCCCSWSDIDMTDHCQQYQRYHLHQSQAVIEEGRSEKCSQAPTMKKFSDGWSCLVKKHTVIPYTWETSSCKVEEPLNRETYRS